MYKIVIEEDQSANFVLHFSLNLSTVCDFADYSVRMVWTSAPWRRDGTPCERSVGKLLKELNFSSMSDVPCTRKATLRHSRPLQKLRRAGAHRNPAGACRAGRSKSGFSMKPASESGGTLPRIWAKRGARPARPAVHLGLPVRRHLPGARHRRRPGHAGSPYRRHEQTSGRNQQMRQHQCHRPADPRRCWLAQFATTHRARKYRAHAASALRAR
jgi:hypothetical protein